MVYVNRYITYSYLPIFVLLIFVFYLDHEWSPWSPCTDGCGEGTKSRFWDCKGDLTCRTYREKTLCVGTKLCGFGEFYLIFFSLIQLSLKTFELLGWLIEGTLKARKSLAFMAFKILFTHLSHQIKAKSSLGLITVKSRVLTRPVL